MNLPSMFVEYLITGSCALLWLRIFLLEGSLPQGLDLRGMNGPSLALLVPAIYVLGMLVDFMGKGLVVALEKASGRFVKKTEPQVSPLQYWDIFLHAPEVGKQIEMRSSRDRVARGALANIVIGTTILTVQANPTQRWCIVASGALLAILFSGIWLRFYIHTLNFEIGASKAISEKLSQGNMRGRQDTKG